MFLCTAGAAMATGKSTPLRTTRNSEMPSTPTLQEMPKSLIQTWLLTNWKPPSPRWNCVSMATATAPVAMDAVRPTIFAVSGRPRGMRATTSALMAGNKMRVVRMGKPTWPAWAVSAASTSASDLHRVENPAEQHDGAGGDPEGVVAHEAGLEPAEPGPPAAH